MLRTWKKLLGLAAFALAAGAVQAQEGPAIRLVVGFPPGDTSDTVARLVAEKMRVSLKQAVLVENRPGAGGILAAEFVKAAPADGNTLLLSPLATMVTFPYTFDKLRYDPRKDFEPVAELASFDLALATNAASGPRSLGELAQRARTDKTLASFGTPAAGSLPHFFGLMYGDSAKIEFLHVAYRGDAPAKQALLSGEIGSMVAPIGSFIELHKAGKVRILATSGARRNPLTPTVPTFSESGIEAQATPWFGLFAPAQTPSEAIARISRAALDAVNDPSVKATLLEQGVVASNRGSSDFRAVIQADHQRWSVVIRQSGFKAN
jgi:tripartite-type tricarboxylate transporter receptor subunit TctC